MSYKCGMIDYETYVKPYSKDFIRIEISQDEAERIDLFVKAIIQRKAKEVHHKHDNNSHYKRYYTGTLGELALEKYLGVANIVDWTIGDSNDYHAADLRKLKLNVGVKTVDYGSFPLIFKISHSAEIIMIKWEKRHVYICGLASKDILNKYQSINLVNDRRIIERGTKTGFYGFQHLKTFNNIDELKKLLNANNL